MTVGGREGGREKKGAMKELYFRAWGKAARGERTGEGEGRGERGPCLLSIKCHQMQGDSVVCQSSEDDDVRIEKLLAWAKSHHVWMHDEAVVGKMEASLPSTNSNFDEEAEEEGDQVSIVTDDYPDREKRARGAGFSVYVKPGGKILERQVSESRF